MIQENESPDPPGRLSRFRWTLSGVVWPQRATKRSLETGNGNHVAVGPACEQVIDGRMSEVRVSGQSSGAAPLESGVQFDCNRPCHVYFVWGV